MKTILIVDDSRDVRDLMKMILEDEGFEIRLASSGIEALFLLEEHSVDLVISDLEMPRGDGGWLLENLRVLAKAPPLILLSGNILVDEVPYLQKGALAFFRKPFQVRLFIDFIEMSLRKGQKIPE